MQSMESLKNPEWAEDESLGKPTRCDAVAEEESKPPLSCWMVERLFEGHEVGQGRIEMLGNVGVMRRGAESW